MATIIDSVLNSLTPIGLSSTIFYGDEVTNNQNVYTYHSRLSTPDEKKSDLLHAALVQAEVINVAGQKWTMHFTPTKAYVDRAISNFPFFVLIASLVLTFFATLYFGTLSLKNKKLKEINEERSIANKELKIARESAEQATQAKSEFLANMSHEIRTPLTAIIGFSEKLSDDTIEFFERTDAAKTITRNAEHLLELINDILDFSKIEAEKLEVEKIDCNLADVLAFLRSSLQPRANNKGLAFGVEFEFPVPRVIKTDPLRLKQILLNLVSNAIKFTETGGVKLHISFDKAISKLSFAVIDTGIGLTTEESTKLFAAFSQADSSTTKRFGGTGLGLVISKRLANLLGGDIILESKSGRGSTFTLICDTGPISEDNLTNEIHEEEHHVAAQLDAWRFDANVLIADDGVDNQRLLSYLLKKVGCKVVVAENGLVALNLIHEEDFDLVLMDMQMPVMDGYTATAKIRQAGYVNPIIGCTADASIKNADLCRKVGCTDLVIKPFKSTTLFSALQRCISSLPKESKNKASETLISTFDEKDHEFLKIRAIFLAGLRTRIEAIMSACHENDLQKIAELAHKISGATMFGFPEIAKAASQLERRAESEDGNIEIQLKELTKIVEDVLKNHQQSV